MKYRIVEMDGRFYPQKQKRFLFFKYWASMTFDTRGRTYTGRLKNAQDLISTEYRPKQPHYKKIHPYP